MQIILMQWLPTFEGCRKPAKEIKLNFSNFFSFASKVNTFCVFWFVFCTIDTFHMFSGSTVCWRPDFNLVCHPCQDSNSGLRQQWEHKYDALDRSSMDPFLIIFILTKFCFSSYLLTFKTLYITWSNGWEKML